MGENKLFASTLALDKSVLPTDSGIDDPWISYPQSRSYGFDPHDPLNSYSQSTFFVV